MQESKVFELSEEDMETAIINWLCSSGSHIIDICEWDNVEFRRYSSLKEAYILKATRKEGVVCV